jgi:hypothetical protein
MHGPGPDAPSCVRRKAARRAPAARLGADGARLLQNHDLVARLRHGAGDRQPDDTWRCAAPAGKWGRCFPGAASASASQGRAAGRRCPVLGRLGSGLGAAPAPMTTHSTSGAPLDSALRHAPGPSGAARARAWAAAPPPMPHASASCSCMRRPREARRKLVVHITRIARAVGGARGRRPGGEVTLSPPDSSVLINNI